MKETYDNVKKLLDAIDYKTYNWDVCGDFKMIGFLLGLQEGFTKYSCFLCLWDCRASNDHYKRAEWPKRIEFLPGQPNVLRQPLVDRNKILLPPLHIKLGLVKQFVTAMDFGGEAFQEIRLMYPKMTEAKLKGGDFYWPSSLIYACF